MEKLVTEKKKKNCGSVANYKANLDTFASSQREPHLSVLLA